MGTIIVRVPVNVAASATNGNNTANLDGGGDPACTAATGQACDPTVPVPVTTPVVTVAKTASPAAGTPVAVGQTITYTPDQHRDQCGHHNGLDLDRHLGYRSGVWCHRRQPWRLHLQRSQPDRLYLCRLAQCLALTA
ncbi:MAG: hypothetical protein IPI14_11980 [Polaromonas sp.]|nr:hypothetical protein [Polaromonas sp.]